MKKASGSSIGVVFLVAALAVLLLVAVPVAAQNCSPLGLISCAGALSGSPPSPTCCSGLRQRQSCFCQYLNDPNISQFFTPEIARRFAAECGITIPTNCPP